MAPEAPNAIMCDETALAPADVPATTAPAWNRVVMASARRVPPIVDDSRSWLPPVRNTPLASRTTLAACSSFAWERVTAWSGLTTAAPSSVKISWYRSPASVPREMAVLMTAIWASRPPASATNRPRMTRSRTLSSAPPMTMTVPCVMLPGSIAAGDDQPRVDPVPDRRRARAGDR